MVKYECQGSLKEKKNEQTVMERYRISFRKLTKLQRFFDAGSASEERYFGT